MVVNASDHTPILRTFSTVYQFAGYITQMTTGNGPSRDKLFLLQPGFLDPKYPGRLFYCWHCALLDGVLASFPQLANRIEIVRVPWPRPRGAVISLVGETNQSLPLMVLAAGETSKFQTGIYGKLGFISGKDKILAALIERHGIPEPHP